MPGILYEGGDRQGVESFGVYEGVLVEDMVATVRRVKKPFIDVYIEDLFFKDAGYPLTYVTMSNMILPLKKDQKVYVYFNQSNHRYPVLWKLADGYPDDSDFLKDFNLPSGGTIVKFPSADETTEAFQLADDSWLIRTASYSVLRRGSQCAILGDSDVWLHASGDINIKATNINIEASNNLSFKTVTAESQGNVKAPKAGGGFLNALPNDPLSGAPHQG